MLLSTGEMSGEFSWPPPDGRGHTTRGSIRVLVLPLPTCMILDKLAMSINFFIISNEIITVKIITPA